MKLLVLTLALAAIVLPTAASTPQEALRGAVEARYLGDRSGACIAAAMVGETPASAIVFSDPKQPRKVDAHTTFEIGSVAKTMASALVADLILKGDLSLEDPLSKLLPKGTKVPEFQGKPITLGHILSHRSGLPSLPGRMHPADLANPYASLTPEQLLGSLGDVKLEEAPGSHYRYSNFGMMLLSYGLALRTGRSFPTLLDQGVFKPLEMADAHLDRDPAREAQGHASNGRPTPAWDFPGDLAGAGGVRASLTDLIHFVEGELGTRKTSITPALALTQVTMAETTPAMAMNWIIMPLAGRNILLHEGNTGGFSSLVALDPEFHQGVVLLADTALGNLGGLIPMGLSLLEASAPPPGYPRRPAVPGEGLLNRMVGRYHLPGGQNMILEVKGGKLFVQAEGQPSLELGYDSTGDFYALDQDLIVHPVLTSKGYTFSVRQGGGQIKAERILASPPNALALKIYLGVYKFPIGFSVKVFTRGDQLIVQGDGQMETPVEATDKDVFYSEASGAEFKFMRDKADNITSVQVTMNGQSSTGEKR